MSTNKNTMSIQLYHVYEEGISQCAILDIAIKTTQKMIEHNIPMNFKGAAIAKDYDISEGYSQASRILKNLFYERRLHSYSFTSETELKDFEIKLAEAIFKNELGENKDILDDFEFNFKNSKFLFCSFFTEKTKNKTSIVYLFIPLEENGEKAMDNYRRISSLEFDNHMEVEQLDKFIRCGGDIKMLQKAHFNDKNSCKSFTKNILKAFADDKYSNITFTTYSEVRLENSYVKFLTKLAKFLGYGDYMIDMKQSIKDALGIYMFQGKNEDLSIFRGLELDNTKVFYLGKGPDKEILVVMS